MVDYKTGAMPREAFEGKALFQMKFYALVLWRTRGVVAAQLKLLYLKDGDALTYAPDEAELVRFERTLQAIWAAIERAVATGDFRPEQDAGCATGATTRRSARPSAALPRRSRPRRPRPPAGDTRCRSSRSTEGAGGQGRGRPPGRRSGSAEQDSQVRGADADQVVDEG